MTGDVKEKQNFKNRATAALLLTRINRSGGIVEIHDTKYVSLTIALKSFDIDSANVSRLKRIYLDMRRVIWFFTHRKRIVPTIGI